MKQLIIFGLASRKEIKRVDVSYRDFDMTLMNFLVSHGIPVASSCKGDGICQKCAVVLHDEKILSCQKTIRDLFRDSDSETVSFSYL